MKQTTQLSPRRAEILSLVALGVQVAFFVLALLVGGRMYSQAVLVEGWHFLGGALIWAVLAVQFRQRRLAQEERLEADELDRLRREGQETSVFEGAIVESEIRLAGRRLAWIEKWFVPGAGFLLAVYLVAVGWWQWTRLMGAEVGAFEPELVLESAAYLAGIALVSFLFSRYAVGMSQAQGWRPLRAGGSYLLSNALACFALTILLPVSKIRYPGAERVTGLVLAGLMVVLGAEVLLNLLMDMFRPRVAGQYHRAAFESRLLGLFSEPGGILRTAAHAIDYQFGFKVSETWFYKLIERAVVPLAALWFLTLYSLSCFAVVPAGSVGVLERWGRPVNVDSPYEAGLHAKWPWPVDRVRVFALHEVQELEVGFERQLPTLDEQGREQVDLTPILWTQEHWKAEHPFLLPVEAGANTAQVVSEDAQPGSEAPAVNLDQLVIAVNVQYRIADVATYGYGQRYSYESPRELLEALCNRVVLHYASTHDLNTVLGPGRQATVQALQGEIQSEANRYELGVEVTFVGMVAVHPPIEVADAFEKVISAVQDKQASILKARGEANATVAQAQGQREVTVAQAQAYKTQRSLVAKAESQRFGQQVEAYVAGGSVYVEREYLSVLDEMLGGMRKYVLGSERAGDFVFEVDLKEKLEPDFFRELGTGAQTQER